MPENSTNQNLEKRLESLEKSLKEKDGEINSLKLNIESLEKKLDRELKERDDKITELSEKLDEMKLQSQPQPASVETNVDHAVFVNVADDTSPPPKLEHDPLILGDCLI